MADSNVTRGLGFIRQRVLFPPNAPLRIMCVGDSQTAGNGDAPGPPSTEASGFREYLFAMLKAQRGAIRMVGNAVLGPSGRESMLADWRMAATGGFTIAQADAQATAAEILDGTADVYIVLAGTNNIAAGNSVATMLAQMETLVRNRLAANPRAYVLVLDLYPWVSPAASFAANNTKRLDFNAQLPAFLAARFPTWQVMTVAAGSLLSGAHMNATGIHANYAGNAIVGQAAAQAVVRVVGSNVGGTWPRNPMRREARPSVYLSNSLQSATIPAQGGTVSPVGAVSFSYGFLYYPTDAGSITERSLLTLSGGAVNRNVWLNAYSSGIAGVDDNVQCFVGAGAPAACEAKAVLKLNTWHAIVVSADISTLLVQLWIYRAGTDGRFVNTMGAAGYLSTPWSIDLHDLIVGAFTGLLGMPGCYSDVWMAVGEVAQPEDAENYYNQLAPPPGVTAYYRLDEGSGVVVAPQSAYPTLPNGSLVGFWAAADEAPTPWDFGEVDISPLRPTPVAKADWYAETSQTTGAAQVMPVGSGATSSTTLTAAVIVASKGELSTLYVRYTGDAANAASMEINFDLLVNGVSVATVGGLASDTTTPQINFLHFPAVRVEQGDELQVTLTPEVSGVPTALTAPVTQIAVSVK